MQNQIEAALDALDELEDPNQLELILNKLIISYDMIVPEDSEAQLTKEDLEEKIQGIVNIFIKKYISKVREYKSIVNQHKDEMFALEQEMNAIKEENEQLTEVSFNLAEQINKLKGYLDESDGLTKALRDELYQLRSDNKQMASSLREIDEAHRLEINSKINGISNEGQDAHDVVLEEEIELYKNENIRLQEVIKKQQNVIEELSKEVEDTLTIKDKLEELRNQYKIIEDLRVEKEQLEELLEVLADKYDNLLSTVKKAQPEPHSKEEENPDSSVLQLPTEDKALLSAPPEYPIRKTSILDPVNKFSEVDEVLNSPLLLKVKSKHMSIQEHRRSNSELPPKLHLSALSGLKLDSPQETPKDNKNLLVGIRERTPSKSIDIKHLSFMNEIVESSERSRRPSLFKSQASSRVFTPRVLAHSKADPTLSPRHDQEANSNDKEIQVNIEESLEQMIEPEKNLVLPQNCSTNDSQITASPSTVHYTICAKCQESISSIEWKLQKYIKKPTESTRSQETQVIDPIEKVRSYFTPLRLLKIFLPLVTILLIIIWILFKSCHFSCNTMVAQPSAANSDL